VLGNWKITHKKTAGAVFCFDYFLFFFGFLTSFLWFFPLAILFLKNYSVYLIFDLLFTTHLM